MSILFSPFQLSSSDDEETNYQEADGDIYYYGESEDDGGNDVLCDVLEENDNLYSSDSNVDFGEAESGREEPEETFEHAFTNATMRRTKNAIK